METVHLVEKLQEAMDAVSVLEPSVPDHVFDTTTHTNNNLGSGTQNNFDALGGADYNNVGNGIQFTGAVRAVNLSKQ